MRQTSGVKESSFFMGDHVHVRLNQGLSVSDDGELVEHSRCRCGATFTKVFDADDGEPEQPGRPS
jgi:hypothetical protein